MAEHHAYRAYQPGLARVCFTITCADAYTSHQTSIRRRISCVWPCPSAFFCYATTGNQPRIMGNAHVHAAPMFTIDALAEAGWKPPDKATLTAVLASGLDEKQRLYFEAIEDEWDT